MKTVGTSALIYVKEEAPAEVAGATGEDPALLHEVGVLGGVLGALVLGRIVVGPLLPGDAAQVDQHLAPDRQIEPEADLGAMHLILGAVNQFVALARNH